MMNVKWIAYGFGVYLRHLNKYKRKSSNNAPNSPHNHKRHQVRDGEEYTVDIKERIKVKMLLVLLSTRNDTIYRLLPETQETCTLPTPTMKTFARIRHTWIDTR